VNFYYNTVTGLQYTGGEDLYSIDISVIPEMDIQEFLEYWKQTSYSWSESEPIEVIGRITEYNL